MKRACDFYEAILGVPTEPDHIGLFIIGGFRFLLFDNESVGEKVTYGDNCLPSFEVSDIYAFSKKLDELGAPIVFPCVQILDNWVLEFRDTEGNDIEVYCKVRK
jgi:Predicted enzyme related to lactoylglutathione lyase